MPRCLPLAGKATKRGAFGREYVLDERKSFGRMSCAVPIGQRKVGRHVVSMIRVVDLGPVVVLSPVKVRQPVRLRKVRKVLGHEGLKDYTVGSIVRYKKCGY